MRAGHSLALRVLVAVTVVAAACAPRSGGDASADHPPGQATAARADTASSSRVADPDTWRSPTDIRKAIDAFRAS